MLDSSDGGKKNPENKKQNTLNSALECEMAKFIEASETSDDSLRVQVKGSRSQGRQALGVRVGDFSLCAACRLKATPREVQAFLKSSEMCHGLNCSSSIGVKQQFWLPQVGAILSRLLTFFILIREMLLLFSLCFHYY